MPTLRPFPRISMTFFYKLLEDKETNLKWTTLSFWLLASLYLNILLYFRSLQNFHIEIAWSLIGAKFPKITNFPERIFT